MGSKNRFLILIMFLFCLQSKGQEVLNYRKADSLTYSYFKEKEWDKLISLGEDAIKQGIDYKFLRQRIGYAYFMKGNYSKSKENFDRSLSFDSYDQFSLEYLYYTNIYTGKEEYFGAYVGKLFPEIRKSLSLKAFKPVESIDFEYDYKDADSKIRSNPQYYRIGITTKISNRLRLYQAFSEYSQNIFFPYADTTYKIKTNQPEYYALIKLNVSDHLILKTAYHYVNTKSDAISDKGNFALISLAPDLNRIYLEAYGSVLSIKHITTYQTGLKAGFTFPGRTDFFLRSTISGIFREDGGHLVYEQKAGLKLVKKIWFEGSMTAGKMADYNDFDGLYIYNSYDPLNFRSGFTLFFIPNRNISFWTNFSFERKEYFADNKTNYHEFSYLGGIRWTL